MVVCLFKGPLLASLKSGKKFFLPFLLGVKTSGFKRKLCYIESTIVPS